MGRRSENLFRRNDVMRAIKSARDAGVPVAGIEITCKDGTVLKVLGENTATMQTAHADAAAVKAWDDATAKAQPEKPATKTKRR
jgi:hypothetical protein